MSAVISPVAGIGLALAGQSRRLRFLVAPVALSFLVLTFVRIGPTDAWRETSSTSLASRVKMITSRSHAAGQESLRARPTT